METHLFIESKDLLSRNFSKEDRDFFFEIFKDIDTYLYLNSVGSKKELKKSFSNLSEEKLRKKSDIFFDKILYGDNPFYVGPLAVCKKEDGSFIGYCGLFLTNDDPEPFVAVLPILRDKGYGKKIIRALVSSVFKFCKFDKVVAHVNKDNIRGKRILEGLNFTFCKISSSSFDAENQEFQYSIDRRSFEI